MLKLYAVFFAGMLVATSGACVSTTQPSFFNDDPVHGGECGNGVVGCHLCPPKADGSREMCMTEGDPPAQTCSYFTHECVSFTPPVINPIGAARDAGP